MKTTHCTRLFGILAALALAACASPSTRMPVAATNSNQSAARGDQSISGRLFDAVNDYRVTKGLQPLKRHAGLDKLAQQHCEYLRRNRGSFSLHGKNVSHYGFDARSVTARELYQMSNIGENVAAASGSGGRAPTEIVQLWKDSKDHHKNMLERWTHSGMGVVVDADGKIFATQLFATKSNSQMQLRERMNSF